MRTSVRASATDLRALAGIVSQDRPDVPPEEGVPPSLLHNVKHNKVLHERIVLLTVETEETPRVVPEERLDVQRLGHGIYRIEGRLGFMQTPDIPMTLKNCKMLGFEVDLEHVHYYIAHEIVVRRARNSAMAAVPFAIYAFLARIASRAPDFFKIPHERVLEVGFHIEI